MSEYGAGLQSCDVCETKAPQGSAPVMTFSLSQHLLPHARAEISTLFGIPRSRVYPRIEPNICAQHEQY